MLFGSRDALPTGKVNVRYEFTGDKPASLAPAARAGCSSMANNKPTPKWSTACRSGSPRTQAWNRHRNGLRVVPKLEYAKILPKYFRGTIEKMEFELGPAKLSAEDLQRIYLQRFARAVRN